LGVFTTIIGVLAVFLLYRFGLLREALDSPGRPLGESAAVPLPVEGAVAAS
jgi:hypothetical protein